MRKGEGEREGEEGERETEGGEGGRMREKMLVYASGRQKEAEREEWLCRAV